MSKHLLGRLALATMPALIMLAAITTAPAAAVQTIDACQMLGTFGGYYRVTQNLTSSCNADCLVVANDRITIDLQGHQISADCITLAGAGITDAGIARDGITVKSGTVSGYDFGINLGASRRTTVRNVTASENVIGIFVGSQSLVKDCHAHHNGTGILGGVRVQIQGCDVSENDFGIGVGDQGLITSNVVSNNGPSDGRGIDAGFRSTVSHNVANGNSFWGIGVSAMSLVTSNVANNNLLGFHVNCPATVTNNTATGNSANYGFVDLGDGPCHENNNKE